MHSNYAEKRKAHSERLKIAQRLRMEISVSLPWSAAKLSMGAPAFHGNCLRVARAGKRWHMRMCALDPFFVLSNAFLVRDARLALAGNAYSPDAGASVNWQILLADPQNPTNVLYNVTPGGLNAQGFASGAIVNTYFSTNLDLSLVQNGTYLLSLVVQSEGLSNTAQLLIQVESGAKIGQFTFSEQDLVVPVAGIPENRQHNLLLRPGWARLGAGVDRHFRRGGSMVRFRCLWNINRFQRVACNSDPLLRRMFRFKPWGILLTRESFQRSTRAFRHNGYICRESRASAIAS
jgi:hypothetical protein